ncbi:hypothetical protein J4E08_08290 [Sagittula sp. NFXS13]|uniref:hypothetical protein n=1 Tax=Sagittula sp. NFXS13 TaxID=2819095 RepID=UPI0032DF53C0
MEKLIVIGILMVFFGAVFALIHFNYRREMRDRAQRLPTLDDQIDVLTRAGLTISPGLGRDDFLAWGPEHSYAHDPWRLILLTLACRTEQPEGRPFSPRAALLDTTAAVDTKELARVTGHTTQATTLDAALADCAAHVSEGSGLYTLENGTDLAVFVLPDQGAAQINARYPGLLERV